jgi:hypothetical protein
MKSFKEFINEKYFEEDFYEDEESHEYEFVYLCYFCNMFIYFLLLLL